MLTDRDRKYLQKRKKQIIDNCPRCKGWDLKCQCLEDYRLEFKKVKASMPPKHRSMTFDKITHPQTVAVRGKIEKYVKNLEDNLNNGLGLFIYGSTGLAKTSMASIVLTEALRRGHTGHFTTLDTCIDMYAGGWKDPILKAAYQNVILGVDVLVLDEVGNESRTNLQLIGSCFNDILRKRYNALQTTIITSNMYFTKIRQAFGDEVYSVLNECTIPCEFKGIDFREGMNSI